MSEEVPTLSGWYSRTSWKSFFFWDVYGLCMGSRKTWLTPGFNIALCCGRREVKYLIRCWVSMKGKRERIRMR